MLLSRRLLAILAVTCLGACSSSHTARPDTRNPSSVAPSPSPSLLAGCVRPGEGTAVVIEAGGYNTDGVLLGSGPRGVVLSHQSDGDLCQMLPLGRLLAARGYLVLLYNAGGQPAPVEVGYVAAELRRRGATRLVLGGGSRGAKASLIAATQIRPPVDGVLSLSAEQLLPPGYRVADYVAKLRLPVLFVTSEHDPFGSADAARLFMRVCPSRDKRVVSVPGNEHGVELLSGAAKDSVTRAVLAFLTRIEG